MCSVGLLYAGTFKFTVPLCFPPKTSLSETCNSTTVFKVAHPWYKRCVREVSLAQVSCILMYVYVAPPTPVGAWSMALGLRQRFIIIITRDMGEISFSMDACLERLVLSTSGNATIYTAHNTRTLKD